MYIMNSKVGIAILLMVVAGWLWAHVNKSKVNLQKQQVSNIQRIRQVPVFQQRKQNQIMPIVEPGYVTEFEVASQVLPADAQVDRDLQPHPSMYQMAWTADGLNPMLTAEQHPPEIVLT